MHTYLAVISCLLLALLPPCSHGLFRSDPRVDSAIKKATAFILSKRDPFSLEWRPMESAAASLGLTSGDPLWRVSDDETAEQRVEVTQMGTALKLSLAKMLLENNGSLSTLDDSTFAQYASAFQSFCVDPSDVLGQDLIAQASKRLEATLQRSPSLAGLGLPLCLHREKLALKTARMMTMPKRNGNVVCESLCMEKAALNVITLSCMFKQEDLYPEKFRATILDLIRENIAFIDAKRAQDSYEQSLFDASLLLQASDVSPVPLGIPIEELFEDVMSYQKPDGSYGGSVTLTALAIPALSHFNALDIPSIKCSSPVPPTIAGPKGEWGIVHYRIADIYLRTQTLIGEFNATLGVEERTLNDVINQFHDDNPAVFRFETRQTPFGMTIDTLGDIPSNPISAWNVYVVRPDSAKEEKVQDLGSAKVQPGMTVVFKYEKV